MNPVRLRPGEPLFRSAAMDQPAELAGGTPDAATVDDRPFVAVAVGKCYSQTANERFGKGASDIVRARDETGSSDPWLSASSQDEWENDVDMTGLVSGLINSVQVPTMQHYRNNLTALSQLYNLYVVAYQGLVYVYVPRSIPKQTIPGQPDLKLAPPQSPVGRMVGGYQDPAKPHTINHVVVAMLGREEIMVASYDDGDVLAYYTKDIANCVLPRPRSMHPEETLRGGKAPHPTPFFHENVAKSAWGLSVHQKSRLIAVSSNKCEVTVFAFALAGARKRSRNDADLCSSCESGATCKSIEAHVRQRARNWRIVVRFSRLVDNMPNIAFVDDRNGLAELVCAVDIKGAAWLAHIWRPNQAVVRMAPSPAMTYRTSDAFPAPARAWGVLPLSTADFLKVDSVEELLGMEAADVTEAPQLTLSIANCLRRVPDNPCGSNRPPALPERPEVPAFLANITGIPVWLPPTEEQDDEDDEDDEDDDEDEDEDGEGLPVAHPPVVHPPVVQPPVVQPPVAQDDEEEEHLGSSEGSDIDIDEAAAGGQGGGDLGALGNSSADNGNGSDENLSSEDFDDDEEELTGDSQVNPYVLSAAGNAGSVWFSMQNGVPQMMPGYGGLSTPLATLLGSPDAPGMLVPDFKKTMQGHHASGDDTSQGRARRRDEEKKREAATCPPAEGLDMIYFPHAGSAFRAPQDKRSELQLMARVTSRNDNRAGGDMLRRFFGKRHRLLRLHEKELELRNIAPWATEKQEQNELGVFCPEALSAGPGLNLVTQSLFHATSRLSMVAHVRDLSLVVVGSPTGRVLLLTPTRLEKAMQFRLGELRYGFRVDWVLPRKSDEKVCRKTMRPLHGMAVGPMPGTGSEAGPDDSHGSGACGGPRRYRLMLHYRNHDILTYEIGRDEHTGRVCIF
ncbi:pyridine nucleotide-disulfide oxidoreductase family protein [Purpureocillium lavendulum]|uniref:Pyridine nucleotide-disulfide oxidoreductase family protein n=1 Tax=Purpureocillium lavendulum TaxID=1247861 RepID=A0AB34G4P7_9HYPO|nr:pyridine nucleotide-disulfide oxidoreductase family protein [Purpureocillium lavendulum]